MPIDLSIPRFACVYCETEFSSYAAAEACEHAGAPPEALPTGTLVMLAPTMGRGGDSAVVRVGRIVESEVARSYSDKPHYVRYDVEGAGHNQHIDSNSLTPHRPGIINVSSELAYNVIHADRLETVLRNSPERRAELAQVLNSFGCKVNGRDLESGASGIYSHTWSVGGGMPSYMDYVPQLESAELREAFLRVFAVADDRNAFRSRNTRSPGSMDALSDHSFYRAAITMALVKNGGNLTRVRAYVLIRSAAQLADELRAEAARWGAGESGAILPWDMLVCDDNAKLAGELRQAVKLLAGDDKAIQAKIQRMRKLGDAADLMRKTATKETAPMNKNAKPFGDAYVVAVAAGKGGTGKSTSSAALGYAAAEAGISTLIVDVDFHGPSLGHLLNLPQGLSAADTEGEVTAIHPHEVAPNLKAFSMQQLISEDTQVDWRGAAVEGFMLFLSSTLDTTGAELVVLDLPPGSGEIERAVIKHLQPDATLLVTTGSHLAHADCRRMSNYLKRSMDTIGVVENMSRRDVSVNGQIVEGRLFGEDGDTERFAASLTDKDGNAPLYLGSLPFNPDPAQLATDGVMSSVVSCVKAAIDAASQDRE